MQHLDTDRLAALADEAPTEAEATHLASCLHCRREREAYVALLELAQRERSTGIAPDAAGGGEPLTSWDSLSTALRTEGLVRGAAAWRTPTSPAPARAGVIHALRSPALWRRAAASIALVVGGAALGRISALSTIAARSNEPTAQVATATPQGGAAGATNAPSSTTAPSRPASRGLSESIAVYGEPNARLASQNAADAAGFASVNDAMSVLTRAQRDYQRAAAYLAEHDSGTVGGTPQTLRARLAALDEVIPKLGEALREAPQDPVLNQYYLSTADVRESTLRQLGRSLPVGVRLNSY